MQHYNLLHRSVQKFAATRPGSWLGTHVWHYADQAVFQLSGRRTTLTSFIAGLPMVMLTTTGAKSGLMRTNPLVAIRDQNDPGCFALVASNWGQDHHPGWYHNLKATPQASCTIEGDSKVYLAHEAEGEEYDYFWQLANKAYFGYTMYRERVGDRRIPIMVLELVPEAGS